MKRVLVLDGTASPHHLTQRGLKLLEKQCEVIHLSRDGEPPESVRARVQDHLANVDAVLLSPWSGFPFALTPEHLDRARQLKVIAGNFDYQFPKWVKLQDLHDRDICLVDTSRSMTPSVAEFAFAMTLAMLRDIPNLAQRMREGKWRPKLEWNATRQDHFVQGDLRGKRVGLAGFGTINRFYAQFCRPFDCRIVAYDPYLPDEVFSRHGVERMQSMEGVAAESEIFSVGIPPAPHTERVVSREVIMALPAGSLFVLVTRMFVVEQDALWERVRDNQLRVALDVFMPEPPEPDAWFRTHPNCLLTPHMAGGPFYCHERCFFSACEDALAVLNDEAPEYAATQNDVDCYAGEPAPF